MRKLRTVTAILLLALSVALLIGCTSALDEAKTAAIDSLNSAVNTEDYREDQQKEISDIISEYEEKINASESEEDVTAVLDEGTEKLAEVKTDAELTKEEEEKAAEEAAKKKAEEEAQKKAEEEYQEYLQQQQQQQQQQQKQQKKQSGGGSSNKNSKGCVDDSAEDFY